MMKIFPPTRYPLDSLHAVAEGLRMNAAEPHELIRYVQLETGTTCNYKCRYCPVAYLPRSAGYLPLPAIAKIAADLARLSSLERIYLNGYDEPTLNPELAQVFEMLSGLPAKISLLTNGSRLTRQLAERIVGSGANVEFDIHLSAAGPAEFRRIHQSPLHATVMRNLQDLAESPVARQVEVHVSMQGRDNAADNAEFSALKELFVDAPFQLHRYEPNDRSGILRNEYYQGIFKQVLRGCGLQNRTLDWLHINATGAAIVCCQDYHERYVIGNVHDASLIELANSDQRARYHAWTTGSEAAPADYLCRRCAHALGE